MIRRPCVTQKSGDLSPEHTINEQLEDPISRSFHVDKRPFVPIVKSIPESANVNS